MFKQRKQSYIWPPCNPLKDCDITSCTWVQLDFVIEHIRIGFPSQVQIDHILVQKNTTCHEFGMSKEKQISNEKLQHVFHFNFLKKIPKYC